MSKEIKKIGSNIEVKGLIIHQVIKDAGNRKTTPKLAKKTIKVEQKEHLFIGKINSAYFTKSGPTYGIFAEKNSTFKNALKLYLKNSDFYKFSVTAVEYYKTILEDTIAATGGFVIFSHFFNTEKKFDYLLVMTTNNKDGFMVSENDLTIKDIKNIDLSKVDVACMINLSKWIGIDNGTDKENKTYLSFAKGNKNVSYYFMSFIDCEDKTTSTESTQRLIDAINGFYDDNQYPRETKVRKRNEIYRYCIDCLTQKKEIQLSAISAIVDVENPAAFTLFASNERYSVSPIISGDKSKLRTIKYISFSDDNIKVEFDLDHISRGRVVYNSSKNQLTIKNVPAYLKDLIPE